MVIGILQFELLIHDAESIKDKRRVLRSVKDRLHHEHMVSVAEVGDPDALDAAVMGLACVGSDGRHVGEVLDRITAKLRALTDAELGPVRREIIHGIDPAADARADGDDGSDRALRDELLRHYDSPGAGRGEPRDDRA